MVNKDYNEEHKLTRKKLWIDVFVAYTSSSNSTSKNGGATWADFALKEFDERFKKSDKQLFFLCIVMFQLRPKA